MLFLSWADRVAPRRPCALGCVDATLVNYRSGTTPTQMQAQCFKSPAKFCRLPKPGQMRLLRIRVKFERQPPDLSGMAKTRANVCQNCAELDQIWQTLDRRRPSLAAIGQTWPDLGRCVGKFCCAWPKLGRLEPKLGGRRPRRPRAIAGGRAGARLRTGRQAPKWADGRRAPEKGQRVLDWAVHAPRNHRGS